MNTSILLMQWDYIYALPAGYLSRALALTFNSTSPDHQKKATEQEKGGKEDHEKVNETYFCHKQSKIAITCGQVSYPFCKLHIDPASGDCSTDANHTERDQGVQAEVVLIFAPQKWLILSRFWFFENTQTWYFCFQKAEFLSYFPELWGSVLFQWSPPISGFVIFVPLLVPWAFYKLALELSWGIFGIFKA